MTDPGRPDAYERRIVTVLFADLVGFTTLSEQLDPEDVAAIQDRYFAAVRETVDRHGGVVEKFIGDAAMAAFGVPRTADDDPERAVLAGLAIAAAVERLNAPLGLAAGTLSVRVGIATGEVAYAAAGTDEGRLTGDTVNTAARLQTAAPSGRVLVGEATALAVAEAVDLEPATSMALKGKADAVRASLIRGVRPSRSREAAMADLRAPTLGRELEISMLLGAAERVRRDHATETWLVVAPPGTGKTRLLDEVAAALPIAGGVVHRARFRARDARPFGALTDLAASAVSSALTEPAAVSAPTTSALAAAIAAGGLPEARAEQVASALLDLAGAGDGSGDSRDARFAAWLAGLDALAAGSGTTWLIEDLHWAGPDAVAFLDLARSTPAIGGRLVIATTRPAFLEGHPDWADDDATAGRRALELASLPQATTAALVAALVGPDTLPPELVARIAAASDGNCLFVEELLRLWVSAGLLARDGATWRLASAGPSVGVPTSVQAIYAAQLDELPGDARQVVRRGAVSGRRVAAGWLDRMGVAAPLAAVESLRARRLLEGPTADPLFGSAFVYRHALLRDAAYASLARSDRAALHVRFARWLETATTEPDDVAELLGDHLEAALDAVPVLAPQVDDGLDRVTAAREAAVWQERAAVRALRAGARDHAVELLARAVARTPTGPGDALDLARRERRLGEATAEAGRMDAAVERLRSAADRYRSILAADPAPDAAAEARAGLAATGNALARVLHEQLLFEESAATAEQILGEIGDGDDGPAAWLRLRAATARYMFSDDEADILPTAREVVPIAERIGDRELALEARLALIMSGDVSPGDLIAAAPRVAELARALDRHDIEARTLRLVASAVMDRGDDPTAALDEARAFAVSRGLDEALGWADYLRAEWSFGAGRWDTTMDSGLRAVELGERHGYLRIVVRTWHALVPVAAERDDHALLGRAADWYDRSAAFFPDSPYGRLMHACVDSLFSSRQVRPRPPLDPDRLLDSFSISDMPTWFEAADVVVREWLADGRAEAAREAVRHMTEDPNAEHSPLTRGGIATIRARVLLAAGSLDEAAAELRRALASAREASAPLWIARIIRLLDQAGASTAAELAEVASIERRLGIVGTTP